MQQAVDISREITFQTARSGGKGGQNVNMVETMVEGYLDIPASTILTPEQKSRLLRKLQNRTNAEGVLQVRSQVHRSQYGNRQEVVRKMQALVEAALRPEKPRLATRPTKASKQKRLETKKITSGRKDLRRKIRITN